MLITNIIQCSDSCAKLSTTKLPFKTAYKLSKLSKAIEDEVAFYREKMQELINEYGQKDEDGDLVFIDNGQGIALKPETQAECYAKIAELEALDIELPDIKFSVDEFADTTLSLEELQPILPFIEE
jgi:hypothetical protein